MATLEKQAKSTAKEQAKVCKLRKNLAEEGREINAKEEGLNSTRTLDVLKEQEAELQRLAL